MNKKNMILAINVMVCCTTSMLPMSDSEKRAIRKELYSNYEHNRINTATLAENDLTLSEVIDRDIQLLFDHKNVLQAKIDLCKSTSVRSTVPFLNKLAAGFFGSITLLTGTIHAIAADKVRQATQNGNLFKKTGNLYTDYVAYYQMTTSDYEKVVAQNLAWKLNQNPEVIKAVEWLLPSFFLALASGGVCLTILYHICRYHGKLNACTKKLQKRFERDQAIIVQLKEIKQTV
ncbi:MAG TPA: hypothetical protein VLB80_00870 [Candidatus Babeliales bacterium]|nr:hypothetical protein [Candidatus Babeliales bacterium]